MCNPAHLAFSSGLHRHWTHKIHIYVGKTLKHTKRTLKIKPNKMYHFLFWIINPSLIYNTYERSSGAYGKETVQRSFGYSSLNKICTIKSLCTEVTNSASCALCCEKCAFTVWIWWPFYNTSSVIKISVLNEIKNIEGP